MSERLSQGLCVHTVFCATQDVEEVIVDVAVVEAAVAVATEEEEEVEAAVAVATVVDEAEAVELPEVVALLEVAAEERKLIDGIASAERP